MNNEMKLEFDAVSENEGFARVAVAAFITPLDPTLEEVADIKTAVSEAVTNAIIHGYAGWSGDEPARWRSDAACGEMFYISKSKIRAEGLRMWSRPWSRCLPPGRIWTVPVWVLPSWRPLWTIWM